MDKKLLKKIIALAAISILLLNMLFAALKFYSLIVFWAVIIIIAILAWAMTKLIK